MNPTQTVTRLVCVNDIVIGQITNSNGFFVWTPGTLPYPTMKIETTVSHHYHHIEDHLKWAVTSQMAACEAGRNYRNVNTLHPDLRSFLVEGTALGTMIKHPLFFWGGTDPIQHAMINASFRFKKEKSEKAFDQKRWNEYIYLHERAYRFDAFSDVATKDRKFPIRHTGSFCLRHGWILKISIRIMKNG